MDKSPTWKGLGCLKPIITSRSLDHIVGALLDSQASIPNCLPKLFCADVLLASRLQCPGVNSIGTFSMQSITYSSFFEFSHYVGSCTDFFCKQGHFHRFHPRTTSSRRIHFPLHRNFSISEQFLDLSLSKSFRILCRKSWITFSRTDVTAGSAFLVTISSHVLASICASSKSLCNARECALRLSG